MMNPELEKALKSVITEELIRQIIRRTALYRKKGMVLFTGATLGFGEGLEAVRRLREHGMELTVYLTESAAGILPEGHIRQQLGDEVMAPSMDDTQLRQRVREADVLLVPSMTINTAAKIACGFTDSRASAMAAAALQKGTSLIIARDGCCPDVRQRMNGDFRANEAYRRMMSGHLETIASYGAVFTSARRLDEVCVREMLSRDYGQTADRENEEKRDAAGGVQTFGRKIITAADAAKFREGSSVRTAGRVIITDLARETLAARHIVVSEGE